MIVLVMIMMKLMVMMTMVQEEVDDEEIRNAYEFDLGEEEDVRAHSTRAEDFNFSEFIFILLQKIDVFKNTYFVPLNLNIESLPPLIINKKHLTLLASQPLRTS